jgi:hypothetical protein
MTPGPPRCSHCNRTRFGPAESTVKRTGRAMEPTDNKNGRRRLAMTLNYITGPADRAATAAAGESGEARLSSRAWGGRSQGLAPGPKGWRPVPKVGARSQRLAPGPKRWRPVPRVGAESQGLVPSPKAWCRVPRVGAESQGLVPSPKGWYRVPRLGTRSQGFELGAGTAIFSPPAGGADKSGGILGRGAGAAREDGAGTQLVVWRRADMRRITGRVSTSGTGGKRSA